MLNLNLRCEQKGRVYNIDLGSDILDTTAGTSTMKTKLRKPEMDQTDMRLHRNGNSRHSIKAIYRLGEIFINTYLINCYYTKYARNSCKCITRK